jgi:hypothetical protein
VVPTVTLLSITTWAEFWAAFAANGRNARMKVKARARFVMFDLLDLLSIFDRFE